MKFLAKALATSVLACATIAGSADAATFEVNLATDIEDIQLGDTPNACDVSVDPGPQCTLRAAIQESNASAGGDRIDFAIPGDGVHTLTFASELPPLADRVMIDGYTQPGSRPNSRSPRKPLDTKLRIVLDGTNVALGDGIEVASGGTGSSVRGLSFVFWQNAGVHAANGRVRLTGNFLGATPDGLQAGNGDGFTSLGGAADGSVIGGRSPSKANLIHGNVRSGIASNQGVAVQGNRVSMNGGGSCNCGAVALFEANGSNIVKDNHFENNVYSPVVVFNSSFEVPTFISRNTMLGNGLITGLGIDLVGDGATPNDPGEEDQLQNAPDLRGARIEDGHLVVHGTLQGRPRDRYRIELYAADDDRRQGRRFLGVKNVETNGHLGLAPFTIRVPKLRKGSFVTATASALEAEPVPATSEFSNTRKVKK